MAKQNPDDLKRDVLARSATQHLHPELVTDELFRENPFFDPRDVVQVKYEMLRRVRVDGHTVSQAAATSGLSRPTYYQAREAFERGGLAGLLPDKKGPKRSYKLTAEVLAFVDAELAAHPERTPTELAERLQEQLGVAVHPKSIGRARARRKKNRGVPR